MVPYLKQIYEHVVKYMRLNTVKYISNCRPYSRLFYILCNCYLYNLYYYYYLFLSMFLIVLLLAQWSQLLYLLLYLSTSSLKAWIRQNRNGSSCNRMHRLKLLANRLELMLNQCVYGADAFCYSFIYYYSATMLILQNVDNLSGFICINDILKQEFSHSTLMKLYWTTSIAYNPARLLLTIPTTSASHPIATIIYDRQYIMLAIVRVVAEQQYSICY